MLAKGSFKNHDYKSELYNIKEPIKINEKEKGWEIKRTGLRWSFSTEKGYRKARYCKLSILVKFYWHT